MTKKIIGLIITVCLIALCSSALVPAASDTHPVEAPENTYANAVNVRFLNMLNHNFAYNDTFDSAEAIVTEASLALLDRSEDEFIKETYLRDFVKDMYGIEIEDFSEFQPDLPKREGYVYIIPRGYTRFEHSEISVTENEDGSFTVISTATATPHDSEAFTCKAVSLFVKNDSSSFGYNLIYSDLLDSACDM